MELHGARPRAIEAFHEGYNPRAARAAHGSWLGFVESRGGLDAGQQRRSSAIAPSSTSSKTRP